MKLARIALIGVAALFAVLLVGLAIALSSQFQTWVVQREIRRHPEWHITVAKVDAGFGGVELTDVRLERHGIRLTAPRIEARLPLPAAIFFKRLHVSRLVASNWLLDTGAAIGAASTTSELTVPSNGPRVTTSADAVTAPAQLPTVSSDTTSATAGFAGLLPMLQLPFDLSIDDVDLAGKIVATGHHGSITIKGGGLRSRREGKFDVTFDSSLEGEKVKALHATGTVTATMDTPRTFARVTGGFVADASGPSFPRPMKLRTEAAVGREAQTETYSLRLVGADRRLADLAAEYPMHANRISGRWKLDLSDRDVAPFLFGRAIPTFTAVGEGQLDTDAALTAVHAAGELSIAVDQLGALKRELAAIGPAKLVADFDVAQRGDVITVTKCEVTASADRPVAVVRSLQPFDFNPKTGDLRASDGAHEVFDVRLEGVPLTWAKPFLRDFAVTGSDIRGEFVATPRAGGFSFHSKAPLTAAGVAVARAGRPLIEHVDVSLSTSGDYAPQGWQVELTGLTAKTGAATVLLLDARAGRLTGAAQPIKATGLITADLAALVAQPILRRSIPLHAGDATIDFVASLGEKKELQADIALKRLTADAGVSGDALPAITTNLRADLTADGKIAVNAPIVLHREQRDSDLTIVGSYAPSQADAGFDAQVTSNNLVIDDAKALAALFTPLPRAEEKTRSNDIAPTWAKLRGTLALQLKKVVYSGTFQMSNVTGLLRFGGGKMTFEKVHAAAGEGDMKLGGALLFQAGAVPPYRLGADIALTDFDPGPLFRAINPRQAPSVEGKFIVTSKLTSQAASIAALSGAAAGDCELTSKGGVFRGVPVNVGNLVENSGKLAGWLASAGSAITSLAGRKDFDEITSRSQAASELAKMLAAISYDQLSAVVSRDEAFNTSVKEFTLISPEFRLNGSGRATAAPGKPLLADKVMFEFQLRARGRSAELMKYLGVLEPKTDDLGYAACTIPIKVGGTLSKLDATEFSNRLVALAVEKTGFADKLTDKAVDLINRLRGKSPN